MMRHRPPGLSLEVLKDHLDMPMLQTAIDAEAGAATNGGRRPTVVAAPASASPEFLIVRAGEPSPRRTSSASWPIPIVRLRPEGSAPSCVARVFTRRPSPTGARQRDAGAFGALVPAKRGPKTGEPNPLTAEVAHHFNGIMPVSHAAPDTRRSHHRPPKKSCGAAGHPAGAERRRALTDAVVALAPDSGMTAAACAALGVLRASVQRRRTRLAAPPAIRPVPDAATGAGIDRPATADRARSAARAALCGSLADRGLRHLTR